MAKIYAALIEKGIKKLEDVPLEIRNEVEKELNKSRN